MRRPRIVSILTGVFLVSSCAAPGVRLSEEAVTDDGLHLVRQSGQGNKGNLLVSPELQRVGREIRETSGAMLQCQVVAKEGSGSAAADAERLEQMLCDAVRQNITQRPRPRVGPGSESPSRVVDRPGPGVMAVRAFLIDAEVAPGGTLQEGSRPTFSLRLDDSVDGKPVMRYYEKVPSSTSVAQLVERSMDRIYDLYEQILNTVPPDVAAPPPGN